MRTNNNNVLAILTLGLLLSACGGGSGDSTGADTPATGDTPTTPVTPVPPVNSGAATDLQAFAAAWVSYNLVQSVPLLQLTAGASDSCGLGGAASYDAAAKRQTLTQCRTRQFPDHVFSGVYAVTSLSADAGRSHVVAALGAPQVTVSSADSGAREFSITGGEIASEVLDSDAGDSYLFTAPSLSFSVGQSSQYSIGNAGSTSISVGFEGGVPVRLTNNLVYTTGFNNTTWQVTTMNPIRESGDKRPDRGSLMIVRLGALQALNATFGANNTLTLTGGEDGGTRTLNWSDAALQAALAAARQ